MLILLKDIHCSSIIYQKEYTFFTDMPLYLSGKLITHVCVYFLTHILFPSDISVYLDATVTLL